MLGATKTSRAVSSPQLQHRAGRSTPNRRNVHPCRPSAFDLPRKWVKIWFSRLWEWGAEAFPADRMPMQNRFGFKDLILVVLIVLLIVVVLLGMKQLDRQWSSLQTLQEQGREQTRLLASIS